MDPENPDDGDDDDKPQDRNNEPSSTVITTEPKDTDTETNDENVDGAAATTTTYKQRKKIRRPHIRHLSTRYKNKVKPSLPPAPDSNDRNYNLYLLKNKQKENKEKAERSKSVLTNLLLSDLQDVDMFYLERETKNSELTIFSIMTESGSRLYKVIVYYDTENLYRSGRSRYESCYKPCFEPTLLRIDVIDAEGVTILRAEYNTVNRLDDDWKVGCLKLLSLCCHLNEAIRESVFNCSSCVETNYSIKIGPANYGNLSGPSGFGSNKYILRSREANEDFIIKPTMDICCYLCCCTCCPCSFNITKKIYIRPSSGSRSIKKIIKIGTMKRRWKDQGLPSSLFGIRFNNNDRDENYLRIDSKALLLVSSIYLNAMYFEKTRCCGHIGSIGRMCGGRWCIFSFILVILGLVLFGWNKNWSL